MIRVLAKRRDDAIGFYRKRRGLGFFQPYDSPSLDESPLSAEVTADLKEGMILKVDRETMAVLEILGLPEINALESKYGIS